jgi:hypothetical protein
MKDCNFIATSKREVILTFYSVLMIEINVCNRNGLRLNYFLQYIPFFHTNSLTRIVSARGWGGLVCFLPY